MNNASLNTSAERWCAYHPHPEPSQSWSLCKPLRLTSPAPIMTLPISPSPCERSRGQPAHRNIKLLGFLSVFEKLPTPIIMRLCAVPCKQCTFMNMLVSLATCYSGTRFPLRSAGLSGSSPARLIGLKSHINRSRASSIAGKSSSNSIPGS